MNPQSGEAYDNRGLVFVDRGDFERAIADFQKAAELFEEKQDWPNYQAVLARLQGLRARMQDGKAVKMSSAEVQSWVTYYYQNPNPALIPQAISTLREAGILTKETAIPPLVSFFSFVFRDNSEQIKNWFSQFSTLSDSEQKPLILALWYANTPQSREQLVLLQKQVSNEIAQRISSLLQEQPTPIESLAINSPSILDMLWGAFMATGEAKYVIRIMSALPLVKFENDPEKFLIGEAARWSLISNAVQHQKVMEICIAELDRQPVEIASILKEIIEKVGRGRLN